MFKHILLPTDGSELSAAVIKEGIRLAKSLDAKVTGLHVIPMKHTFFYQARISKKVIKGVDQKFKEMAERYLTEVKNEAKQAGVACHIVYKRNDYPYEAIIRLAEQKGCDLIMMASHGRGGLKGFLIGSETQKVLMHSKIPVLVVRCIIKQTFSTKNLGIQILIVS